MDYAFTLAKRLAARQKDRIHLALPREAVKKFWRPSSSCRKKAEKHLKVQHHCFDMKHNSVNLATTFVSK